MRLLRLSLGEWGLCRHPQEVSMKKQIGVVMLAGALAMLGGTAMASSGALSAPKPKVLAVLVQVDAQGHVTKALPSLPLDPEFQVLLPTEGEAHGRPVRLAVL